MREYLRDHSRLLVILLFLSILIVPLFPMAVSPDSVAAQGWLSGYSYRQQITVAGSTGGAQTNYQMKVTAYKSGYSTPGVPVGFDYVGITDDVICAFGDGDSIYSHIQDVYTDGTYIWAVGNDILTVTYLNDQDWDNPIAENLHAMTDGTYLFAMQLNGIFVDGNYIFASVPSAVSADPPYRFFVKWYDKMTLEFVDEQELFWDGVGTTQEGWNLHDNYWWTTYFDRKVVSRYDTGWNYIDSFPIENINAQGITWVGDQLWISYSSRPIDVYNWDGETLTYNTSVSRPSGSQYTQGVAKDPNSDTLWLAEFRFEPTDLSYPCRYLTEAHLNEVQSLVEATITWSGGAAGASVYLDEHVQDDFDDIRFTTSDGTTELAYWREDYTSGVSADFWVEFDSIAAYPSTSTFYIYYDNSGASTASSGADTFIFFDDAETGAPLDTYTEQGVGGYITYNTTNPHAGSKSIKITDTSGNVIYPTAGITSQDDFAVDFWTRAYGTTTGFNLYLDSTGETPRGKFTGDWEDGDVNLRWYDGAAWQDTGTDYVDNAWEHMQLYGTGGDDTIVWDRDGATIATNATRDGWDIIDNWWWSSYGSEFYIDNWFVRNYVDPEPTITGWSSQEYSPPADAPTVTTIDPPTVYGTNATLSGRVDAVNDGSIIQRGFVWDTTPRGHPGNTALNATDYATGNWSEYGSWSTGSYSNIITGLTKGQLYYFRAGVRNSIPNYGYGGELAFVTAPDPPTSFNATTVDETQIDLSWSNGTGADKVKIMRTTGGYSADYNDGYEVFYGTGTTAEDTGLTPGITYFYRAWSYASALGYEQYSVTYDQDSDSTGSAFAVTTIDAADFDSNSALLQASLTDDGGEASSMRFEWGTTELYGEFTTWRWGDDGYTTGEPFYEEISPLLPDTTYHFRAQAKHADEIIVSGANKQFTTFVAAPGAPPTLSAVGTSTQIELLWTMGTGAVNTIIRYRTDTYPLTPSDGVGLFFGTGTNTTHTEDRGTSLVAGITYYYSAWSETNGMPSTDKATTSAALGTGPELSEPDETRIEDVKVFRSYDESGDLLFVITYKLMYEAIPIETPSDYFMIQIWDGTALKTQGTPQTWGHAPASIYQASTHTMTWGSSYTVKLVGRADKWDNPPEATFAMSATNWIGSELRQLDLWVLSTGERIEYYWGDLVEYIPIAIYSKVLTEQGAGLFEGAIPGLRSIRPDLFSSGVLEIEVYDKRDNIYETGINASENFGEEIMADFEILGDDLGIGGTTVAMIFWLGLFALCVGSITMAGGAPEMGVLVCGGLVVGGTALGIVPMGAYVAIGALILLAFLWRVIPRGV